MTQDLVRYTKVLEIVGDILKVQVPAITDKHKGAAVRLGELAMLETVPGPLVADRLIESATHVRSPAWFRKAARETARASRRATDLSCRPRRIIGAADEFRSRGKALVRIAERLGLSSTAAGPATGKLAGELRGFDRVRIVEATCDAGSLFILVAAPRRDIDPDEDPRAHPSGGWEAILASTDLARLQTGAPAPTPHAPVPLDRGHSDVLHPWIPLTELDI